MILIQGLYDAAFACSRMFDNFHLNPEVLKVFSNININIDQVTLKVSANNEKAPFLKLFRG